MLRRPGANLGAPVMAHLILEIDTGVGGYKTRTLSTLQRKTTIDSCQRDGLEKHLSPDSTHLFLFFNEMYRVKHKSDVE